MADQAKDGLQKPAAERRNRARTRAYKAGKIISGNLALSYDCLVRDMSDGGARIAIDAALGLPGEFYFYFPATRLITRARVAWRSPTQIGIQYLEPLVHPHEHPNHELRRVVLY